MGSLIHENSVVFDIDGQTKEDVIRTLVRRLYEAGTIENETEFYNDVLKREGLSPTYIGFDIGLPHGKTDHVLSAAVCFGKTKAPVVWNEETRESADMVILIAVPAREAGDTHMKILANLSRRLMHEDFRKALRSGSKEQVYTILQNVLEGESE